MDGVFFVPLRILLVSKATIRASWWTARIERRFMPVKATRPLRPRYLAMKKKEGE
jgi:hypothetical protein